MNRKMLWVPAMALAVLSTALPAQARTKKILKLSGVVNLNQATAAQLDQLPGVGEKAAAKIITYRQKTPFQRPEELVKVKGFGKKKFDKLKPHLAIAGPTTLKVEKQDVPDSAAAQGRPPPAKR